MRDDSCTLRQVINVSAKILNVADKNPLCFNMNNSLENLPDLQREELLDFADRFTIRVTDSKGVYKGNAFIAEGHVVSAHHVVDENYSIHYPQPYTEVSFAQVGDQDIAESVQLFGINGLKRAKPLACWFKQEWVERD